MRRESRIAQREAEYKAKLAAMARAKYLAELKEEKKNKLAACKAFFMLLGTPKYFLDEDPQVMWVDVIKEKHNPMIKFLKDGGFEVYLSIANPIGLDDYTLYFFPSYEKEGIMKRMEYLRTNPYPARIRP